MSYRTLLVALLIYAPCRVRAGPPSHGDTVAVLQANECSSSGSECLSSDEPKNAVAMIQTNLQMNIPKGSTHAVATPEDHNLQPNSGTAQSTLVKPLDKEESWPIATLKASSIAAQSGAADVADHAGAGQSGKNLNATWEQALARASPFTMVTEDRLRFMYDAVERVNQLGIGGDIVEAGVWKGGTSMLMAIAQFRTSRLGLERHSWLYDTFEGLPAPSSDKDDPRAKDIYDKIQSGSISKEKEEGLNVEQGKWNYGPEELVRENMHATGLTEGHLHLVRGKVEDSLKAPENLPEKIAILRLDTDWYESTKAELKYLLPRLQPGGLLFIDDYCAWQGSREAVDEMLDMHAMPLKETSGPMCAYAWKPLNGTERIREPAA